MCNIIAIKVSKFSAKVSSIPEIYLFILSINKAKK